MAPPARPNVLLVVVDSLRADHLSAHGYTRKTSPFLDEFARRGTRFAQAFSHSSHTKLSVASILTGLTPPSHGLRRADVSEANRSDSLSRAAHTLAETFQEAGYATAGFVANPHLKRGQGFSQGFAKYRYVWTRAQQLNDQALAWLDGAQGPFFLYLHYMDVHFPYDPPAPFRTLYSPERPDLAPLRLNGPGSFDRETIEYSMALYDAEIRYWDDQFRRLVEALEKAGRMDDTAVVVVADHGEEFGEHAGFGHGFTAYGEVLHVPLVVVYEGSVPRGVVREDLVGLVDIAPTIRSLAGFDLATPLAEGSDLFVDPPPGSPGRVVYSETFRGHEPRSLRTSEHQLIYNSIEASWEFYRLDDDPRSLRDRYAGAARRDKALLSELEALLREHMEEKQHALEGESVELDGETIEQLKGLGYLQ